MDIERWYDFRKIGIDKVIDMIDDKFPPYLGILEKQLSLEFF